MDILVQSFRRVIWQYLCIYTLMAKSEEELKSLLMRVKQESEKAGLKFKKKKKKKKRSWHLVPSISGKQQRKKWKQ